MGTRLRHSTSKAADPIAIAEKNVREYFDELLRSPWTMEGFVIDELIGEVNAALTNKHEKEYGPLTDDRSSESMQRELLAQQAGYLVGVHVAQRVRGELRVPAPSGGPRRRRRQEPEEDSPAKVVELMDSLRQSLDRVSAALALSAS